MEYENSVSLLVHGRSALFSDPVMRVGGEKCSYQVPTYQALKGVLESCYWKPTFLWVIDAVRVLNPIRSQSRGMRPVEYSGGNTLSIYTYLTDVAYQVKAHFIWNENRPELAGDRNEDKHYQIAKRMIARGGRRDVFLGCRECQAYVEPCVFGEGKGYYDNTEELCFGLMFHGFTYPDEGQGGELKTRFWYPKLKNGVITFCAPEECPVVRTVKQYPGKPFVLGETVSTVDNLVAGEDGQ